MPQGKGTYGKQVGRPLKKYHEGGSVDPFSSKNPEGIIAEKEMEAIVEQNAIPETNAMDRSETYQLGGMIEPPSAGSVAPPQPQQAPMTPPASYKKGGKVDITDVVKEVSKGEGLAGKRHMIGQLKRAGMSNEQIERFSKEYKSPKEEKIGKMKKKILK